jgi:hypothetical protein
VISTGGYASYSTDHHQMTPGSSNQKSGQSTQVTGSSANSKGIAGEQGTGECPEVDDNQVRGPVDGHFTAESSLPSTDDVREDPRPDGLPTGKTLEPGLENRVDSKNEIVTDAKNEQQLDDQPIRRQLEVPESAPDRQSQQEANPHKGVGSYDQKNEGIAQTQSQRQWLEEGEEMRSRGNNFYPYEYDSNAGHYASQNGCQQGSHYSDKKAPIDRDNQRNAGAFQGQENQYGSRAQQYGGGGEYQQRQSAGTYGQYQSDSDRMDGRDWQSRNRGNRDEQDMYFRQNPYLQNSYHPGKTWQPAGQGYRQPKQSHYSGHFRDQSSRGHDDRDWSEGQSYGHHSGGYQAMGPRGYGQANHHGGQTPADYQARFYPQSYRR